MNPFVIIGAVLVGIAIIVIVVALGSRKPGDSLSARLSICQEARVPISPAATWNGSGSG